MPDLSPETIAELKRLLAENKVAYQPSGRFRDDNYGCDVERPESLVMSFLDNGKLGAQLVETLSDYDYAIVPADLLKAAPALLAAAEENARLREDVRRLSDKVARQHGMLARLRERVAYWSARHSARAALGGKT